jgi:hypothetical protein
MTELRREVQDQGVLWISAVIITIIFFFEELFNKIQERLYNLYIIQADYDLQPLSQTASYDRTPKRSSRPGSFMDISVNYYYYLFF